jgi:hypothetical protein
MRRIRLLGFVVLAGACGRAGDGGGAAVTRDSAGIAIVENTGAAWTSGQEWKVIDSAVIDIGGDFDSVTGPVRLSSGHLAIANAGSHEVRIYDSTGALLHTSGRAGSGPGEYQNLAGVWLGPGDSIMVSDFLVRRLTVLDSAGTYQRSFSLGGTGGAPVPVGGRFELAIPQGWFSDGSVAGVTMSFAINQPRDGVFRDSISAFRYGPDGLVRDTIARFPGIEMESMTMTMGTQSFSAPTAVPLGRVSVSAVQGERFYLAQNNSWEIEVRERNGKLLRLIRLDARPAPITPDDIAAHRQSQLDLIEGMPMMRAVPAPVKSQLKTRIEQAKYPPTFAFVSALLIDGDGNIWVQEVASPRVKATVFAVVDSSGRLLGRVTMPANFRPTTIGTGSVYGVWKDADDVQHLRAYPLRRGP